MLELLLVGPVTDALRILELFLNFNGATRGMLAIEADRDADRCGFVYLPLLISAIEKVVVVASAVEGRTDADEEGTDVNGVFARRKVADDEVV